METKQLKVHNQDLPAGWTMQRLENICIHFKSGYGITSEEISNDGDFPVFGGNGLRGYTHSFTHDGSYLLIGRQGALCGNIQIVTGKNYISEHAIAVQTNSSNDLNFLAYKLDYLNLNRLSESSAQPGLSVEKLLRLKINLPPLPEQKAIARVLRTWDEAIRLTQELIAQKEMQKKWLMQVLLTGKKRLKGFEVKWKEYTYDKLLKVVKRPVDWNDTELYSLISVRRRSGGIFFRETLFGSQIKVKDLRTAQTGDFLFSKMQIVHGASAIVKKEFNGSKISGSYIATIAKNPDLFNMEFLDWHSRLPYFYHQALISSYGVHIEKMTFDFDSFSQLGLKLPTIEEQTAIVSVLQEAETEIEILRTKLTKLIEQKKGLMQQLLTGRKRLKTT